MVRNQQGTEAALGDVKDQPLYLCKRCHDSRVEYVVMSDILQMFVCEKCANDAEIYPGNGLGAMTVGRIQ